MTGRATTTGGLLAVALGAWIALSPFLFGQWAWEWHFGRFLLAVLPGAVAALGGLLVIAGRRRLESLGGGLALAGGLWFVVAPPLYAFLVGPELGATADGESARLFQWLPFLFVGGAFISLVSAYVLGLLVPLQFAGEGPVEPAPRRARLPLPPERPRRQRGVSEPAVRSRRAGVRASGSSSDRR